MATENLDAANLAAVPVGGTIHEDVMDAIFDVSPIDLPFTDGTGTGNAKNTEKGWVRKNLVAANPQNKRVDGSSSSGLNDTVTGERINNFHQIMTKTVRVSNRARYSDTIGYADELATQLMERQKELRRDGEARLVSRFVALQGDGATIAGELAGCGAWIGTGQGSTNSDRGATGTDPVLSGDPGGYPTTQAAAGTSRAGSELAIRNIMKEAKKKGGELDVVMSTLDGIALLSDYLFTSSARVATIQTQAPQGNRTTNATGGGKSGGGVTAQGAVNVFVSNFATIELVPNLFQPEVSADVADLYFLDMKTWKRCYMQGYKTDELAKDGLADNREISVDMSLISQNEEANAVLADIDTTLPFTA